MKKNLSITIKLIITTVLAIIGIMYILEKNPLDEVSDYKKEAMPKPYSSSRSDSFFSSNSSSESSSLSITGDTGAYDEVRIGKKMEE